MKTILSIVLCLGTVFLSYYEGLAQINKLKSVKIEFVGYDIETISDVSCEAFDFTFNEHQQKAKKTIYNADKLVKFQSLTKDFKQITRKQSFDVRGKINYIYDKTTKTYFFDTFGCFYKDGKLYHNKELLIYLTDELNRRHPDYLDTLQYYE